MGDLSGSPAIVGRRILAPLDYTRGLAKSAVVSFSLESSTELIAKTSKAENKRLPHLTLASVKPFVAVPPRRMACLFHD